MAVKLCLDLPQHDQSKLIPRSIDIFKTVYSGARHLCKDPERRRADFGVKRKLAASAGSEAPFSRKRRRRAHIAGGSATVFSEIERGAE
eukprot:7433680-Pyramimonas_sp.AAC.1